MNIIAFSYLFRNGKSLSNNLEKLFSETLEAVDSGNIRSFLKTITSTPHLAASEQDNILTKWIFDKWTEFGIDNVNLERYDLLMSFPDRENPNKIYLKDDQDRVQFTSRHKEDVLRAEDEHPGLHPRLQCLVPRGQRDWGPDLCQLRQGGGHQPARGAGGQPDRQDRHRQVWEGVSR